MRARCAGRQYRSDPAWYEYRLADRGRDLYKPIMAFMRWGDDYLAGPEGPPPILHRNACGHDTRPTVVCEHCRADLDPREITPNQGPVLRPHPRPKAPRDQDGDDGADAADRAANAHPKVCDDSTAGDGAGRVTDIVPAGEIVRRLAG